VGGINNAGAITGTYNDANGVGHGFVRAGNGSFVFFDMPGAVNGTYPGSINDRGDVTGSWWDDQVLAHGFIRTADGTVTSFDFPGAFYTFPNTITNDRVVLGDAQNACCDLGGFLWASTRGFTNVNGPNGELGQIDPFNPGYPLTMNAKGEIAGTYFAPIEGNPFGGNYRVFLRSKDGTYVTFDAATYSPCCIWSAASGINVVGAVTGSFNDGYTINHGFFRTGSGVLTTFDVPGAGTGFNQGTLPMGITSQSEIFGQYRDAANVTHGFTFVPDIS
jgi:hypothetical protein